jgi:hypothetical protein
MAARTFDERLIAAGRDSGITEPHRLRAIDPDTDAAAAAFFNKNITATSRTMQSITKLKHYQILTVFEGKYLVLTNPRALTHGDEQVIIADASNNINSPSPVMLRMERLGGSVVSLATQDQIAQFKMTTIPLSPSDVPPHADHIINNEENGVCCSPPTVMGVTLQDLSLFLR